MPDPTQNKQTDDAEDRYRAQLEQERRAIAVRESKNPQTINPLNQLQQSGFMEKKEIEEGGEENEAESSLEHMKRVARQKAGERVKELAKKAVKKVAKQVIKQILVWIAGFIAVNLYWIVPLIVIIGALAIIIIIIAYAYEDPCGAIDMFGDVISGFTSKVTGMVCAVTGK